MKNLFANYLRVSLSLLVLCGVLLAMSAGFGQIEDKNGDELIEQWMTTIGELKKIRFRYRLADDDQKAAIEREFNELIEKARELEPTVAKAIEERYRKDPTNQRALEPIFVARANAAYGRQDHAELLRLARLLIDGGSTNAEIFALGLVAAAASNQDELVARWSSEAKQRGLKTEQHPLFVEFELRARQQAVGEADATKRLPRVKLETSEGELVLELFEEEAPNTVANFVSLVDKGFYDGLGFHRIVPGFMAQGGDPKGDGSGGPGYHIACECTRPDFRRHFRGSLSMAHAGKDTGGSQFFITFAPRPQLDGLHTVFGRVVEGFDTLDKLEKLGTPSEKPSRVPLINKATVLNKRDHAYQVKKVGKE